MLRTTPNEVAPRERHAGVSRPSTAWTLSCLRSGSPRALDKAFPEDLLARAEKPLAVRRFTAYVLAGFRISASSSAIEIGHDRSRPRRTRAAVSGPINVPNRKPRTTTDADTAPN